MYIVEIEKGVYIAPWSGDPGRTLKKERAKKFSTEIGALICLACARKYRRFENARILKVGKDD